MNDFAGGTMFGRDRRQRQSKVTEGRHVTAEIIAVEFGRLVHQRSMGGNQSSTASRTLRLRVEPDGPAEYEAELKLRPDAPMVPTTAGAREAAAGHETQ